MNKRVFIVKNYQKEVTIILMVTSFLNIIA